MVKKAFQRRINRYAFDFFLKHSKKFIYENQKSVKETTNSKNISSYPE